MSAVSMPTVVLFLAVIVVSVLSQRQPPTIFHTLYVNPTSGKNWNPGTASLPFQTLGKACQTATSHTAILLQSGTYNNHLFGTGAKDNPAVGQLRDLSDIVIAPDEGAEVEIKFDGSGGISMRNITRAEVRGLKVVGPNKELNYTVAMKDRLLHSNMFSGRGIVVWGGSHIHIHSNVVSETPNSGIRVNEGDYVTVENNTVFNCTFWSSSAESAVVFAESTAIDQKDDYKMIIRNNHIYDNINKIPYYNSNYDDPQYLIDNNMHVAREYYGSINQTFIIDGSGVYITRNEQSYHFGRYLLSSNVAHGNGINGLVVHKTDRVLVADNILYDNGKVSRDPPASRQSYAGLTLNHARQVILRGNRVTAPFSTDWAYVFSDGSSLNTDVGEPVSEGNIACVGRIDPDFPDGSVLYVGDSFSACLNTEMPSVAPSNAPSGAPSAAPSYGPTPFPSLAPSATPSNQPTDQQCANGVKDGVETDVDCGGQPSHCLRCGVGRVCVVDLDCLSHNCNGGTCGDAPSAAPSDAPSDVPSAVPSPVPSPVPSYGPSHFPSERPSDAPSDAPSGAQSDAPSGAPSEVTMTSLMPSSMPSSIPPLIPSSMPSYLPSSLDEVVSTTTPTVPNLATTSSPTTNTQHVKKSISRTGSLLVKSIKENPVASLSAGILSLALLVFCCCRCRRSQADRSYRINQEMKAREYSSSIFASGNPMHKDEDGREGDAFL